MGRQGYAEVIDRQIELTQYLASRIDDLSEFERLGQIETAVCCFKFLPKSAPMRAPGIRIVCKQQLQQRIERSGEAFLTTTVLHGRRAMRVNVKSFLTERRHVDDLIGLLEREIKTLRAGEKG